MPFILQYLLSLVKQLVKTGILTRGTRLLSIRISHYCLAIIACHSEINLNPAKVGGEVNTYRLLDPTLWRFKQR